MGSFSEARGYCLQGISCQRRGDLAGAQAGFAKALEVHSGCLEAWNNHGAVRHLLGDGAGALADFTRALEIRPDYAEAYNNRGIVRHALGDLAGALADFDRALELLPRYAEALSSRATTRHALGDLAGALADYDQVLAIHPDYAEAYHGRAAARHALGDLAGALTDYDQVLRLIPRQAAAPVYHLRGGVRISQRRFREAIADYDCALMIDPGLCMVYISRGNARHHLRDLACGDDYRIAFQLNSQAAAAEIIRILSNDLHTDASLVLENCGKHVRMCPEDGIAYGRRGLSLWLLGREAEAMRDFEQWLQRDPDWEAHLELLLETARQHRAGHRKAPASA
ncbi:MAG TPA: tetratricopeptide repeat protein [Gemmataceae bacterium]